MYNKVRFNIYCSVIRGEFCQTLLQKDDLHLADRTEPNRQMDSKRQHDPLKRLHQLMTSPFRDQILLLQQEERTT